ncbi:hypothetical protein WJX73_000768 [Symbiochloris irregularis]|uniref:S-acyltransferase n=1 Tax=Symbiochloris irregularis TaxID=706552 RepID=A0AAW1PBA8_9CHLO
MRWSETAASARPETSGRVVKLTDLLAEARGRKYLGVEEGRWIFILGHSLGVVFLVATNTYLADRVKGVWNWSTASAWDCTYVLCVVLAVGGNLWLHNHLFGSDPGWMPREDFSSEAPGDGICPYCRARPMLRSRHDHHTGQCVPCFDHYCPMLGTTIGDCNHAKFWLYNATQAFITAWGCLLAFQASGPCLWSSSQQVQEACWQGFGSWASIRTVMLAITSLMLAALTNMFSGLWTLHTVLAASGQTTYEVAKGSQVPYLAPFFRDYRGPQRWDASKIAKRHGPSPAELLRASKNSVVNTRGSALLCRCLGTWLSMIEVVLNDRLGKKVRVKCNEDDTIGDLKKLVAAQTGTRPEKIRIQKWYNVFKDHITLADYEIHDGMGLELYYN